MSWREFWNADTPIYVDERHKRLHYEGVARDIVPLIPGPDATVLDHGSGEALSADRVAARCGRLLLCDGAPLVRSRLQTRFAAVPGITVLSPEEVPALPDGSLDLVVVISLLQYLGPDELAGLLDLWRAKLKPAGLLVLADVIPPGVSPFADAAALLGFAARNGFLRAALLGLVRTALSPYRRLRATLGLAVHTEAGLLATLAAHGFSGARRPANFGHNPRRMTILARPA